jgi:hypothetical protein
MLKDWRFFLITNTRGTENQHALEVVRDGHLIFTHGYGGSGPILECIELLGDHMRGTIVRTVVVDLMCGHLLMAAGVTSIETESISPSAFRMLAEAGVDVRANNLMGPDADEFGLDDRGFGEILDRHWIFQRRPSMMWVT